MLGGQLVAEIVAGLALRSAGCRLPVGIRSHVLIGEPRPPVIQKIPVATPGNIGRGGSDGGTAEATTSREDSKSTVPARCTPLPILIARQHT